MVQFSIVTPTYNRRGTIIRSVEASLAWAEMLGSTEVVIVDDASTDHTAELIRHRYPAALADGRLKLLTRETNGGVTAARNDGCRAAGGRWLVFADSDDELLAEHAGDAAAVIAAHPDTAIVFFRCASESGHLIGPPCPPQQIDLDALAACGTPGECLPVVQRAALLAHPFDHDLRGWELLAYLRIVRSHGPALLSDIVARRYGTRRADRLSTLRGRLQRSQLMARGYVRLVREFGSCLSVGRCAAAIVRIAGYGLVGLLWRLRQP